MSITANVYVTHERLALVPTLRVLDDVDIEAITQVNTNPSLTDFPFLVRYHDRSTLESAFDDDPTVERYELVDWTGDAGIYYIEHTPETKLISTVVTEENGYLVHTETKGTGWHARLLLPDREALNAVWEYANEHGIRLDIIEIYGNDDVGGRTSYGLTDEQRAALVLAYEEGYFSEPREVSLDDVAEKMDLSSTAMSGRLRRGMRNLLAATLARPVDGE